MEMFPIITNRRQEVADRTKLILQKNLDDYSSGVTITQALIERAEVHPDVQNAFQEVQSAKQDAESFQNKAEAYRKEVIPAARAEANKLIQQAQAYKETAVARAQGDAKRFLSVYEAYLQGKDVTRERIYIETMETILKNAQKFIIDDKSTGGVVPYLPLGELGQKRPAIGAGGNIANDRLDGGQRP
jgi:membrane protease subunit HflK